MSSNRKYESATWANSYKNALNVIYEDVLANKTTRRSRAVISRYEKTETDEEIETNLFKEILNVFTLDEIDAATEEQEKAERERFEETERRKQEQEEYEKIKKVFETKIEIFNLPEVAESTDREAKSKIRRSKSSVEALINALILVLKERESNESGE